MSRRSNRPRLAAAFAAGFDDHGISHDVAGLASLHAACAVPDAPPLIARGEGAWLETADGERILDAISSWWVITHGHRHPRIMAAIGAQAGQLDQVIFAGFTHQPAEDVARALLAIAPRGLAHVFYSDSGSTAVEVALKMALGFWRNQNRPRSRIIALEHAYHGDTIGTMSAGARGVFNAAYEPLLFEVERLPFPAAGREQETLAALRRLAPGAAALIVEPLILGAGGMLTYGAGHAGARCAGSAPRAARC